MGDRPRLRDVTESEASELLLRALRDRNGEATGADLEVATGLPQRTVAAAMTRLLDRYESRLAVAKGGALVYRFERGFRLRPERRAVLRALLAAAAAVGAAAARTARVAFQVVLAVQLLVYTFVATLPVAVLAGAIVGIVCFVMAIFSDKDLSGVLLDPYAAVIFLAVCVLVGVGWVLVKEYELVMGVFNGRRDVGSKRGQGLAAVVGCVNDFAVGPARTVAADERTDRTVRISLADERRVLARVRAAGGRLRSGDLVRWLGLDLDEADRQATRLAVEHDGTPGSDDLEVIEFQFPSLLDTAGKRGGGRARADEPTGFERGVAAPAHTGNHPLQDLVVAGFALVNLGGGLAGMRAFAGPTTHPFLSTLGRIFGGELPIGFSLFLLGFWLLRWPATGLRAWAARRRRARAAAVRRIVEHCAGAGDRPLDVAADDVPLARALGGASDVDGDADPPRLVWRFDRLAAELRAAPGAPRAQLRPAEVVYEA